VLVESEVHCPGCGELVLLTVDTSAGSEQRYYEDCTVCCRPMEVRLRCAPGQLAAIEVTPA
jgi:Cysteine-rich CPXCG